MNDEFPTFGLLLTFAILALVFYLTEKEPPWNQESPSPHGTATSSTN